MPNTEVIHRLRTWLSGGAVPEELPEADLHDTFCYEDGAFRVGPPHGAEHARMKGAEGFVDITIVADVVAADAFIAVTRGRDPVTELWHQSAWVFLLCHGKVRRLVLTTSGQLPERPYDGTLPLRHCAE